ncbi:flavin reductase family protein [Glutamicibacter sp. PS]|uniref:flavin reductase family protein n=1 Tax=Glutamicibacter sp. PS TaxID=3075634 RepID=UPI00284B8B05|nr:flavin reductase family protein [Glutamicibacter sp. PS]MDR4534980.1 flavin reductase family protein [Glutamicibacter sp. PS]
MSLNYDLDSHSLRTVFARHPSGIAALCATVEGRQEGFVASSFTVGVSLEPPLVMFAVQKSSRTWPRLRRAGRIGISVLSERNEWVCAQLASKHGDRFAGVSAEVTADGALLLDDSAAHFETSIYSEVDAGDHWVVLLRVHAHRVAEHDPVVFQDSAIRRLPTLV